MESAQALFAGGQLCRLVRPGAENVEAAARVVGAHVFQDGPVASGDPVFDAPFGEHEAVVIGYGPLWGCWSAAHVYHCGLTWCVSQ